MRAEVGFIKLVVFRFFLPPLPIFPISPWFLPPAAFGVARRIKIAFPSHVLIDYFLTSMAEPDSFILNAFYSLK
jgi:hypothetical protein